jgi:hypothetical protein
MFTHPGALRCAVNRHVGLPFEGRLSLRAPREAELEGWPSRDNTSAESFSLENGRRLSVCVVSLGWG